MNRGIIASPFVYSRAGHNFIIQRHLSRAEVRYFVLYWDKVVIPDSNAVSLQVPDQELLVKAQIIERPMATRVNSFATDEMAALLLQGQVKVAEKLMAADSSTDWVLHQIGTQLSLPPGFSTELQTVRVDVQNVLPVPDGDVPIEEIIDFKERRKTELAALHEHLDEVYFEILQSPDPSLQSKIAISRLKKSIQDLDVVTTERFKKTNKTDFSVELNLDSSKIMAAAAAAAAFNFYTGSTINLALGAVGGLAPCLKISAKKTISFEAAKKNIKLSYLSQAQTERILKKPFNPRQIGTTVSQPQASRRFLSDAAIDEVRRKLSGLWLRK